MKKILLCLTLCFLICGSLLVPINSTKFVCFAEENISTSLAENAKSAYLIDANSGTVIFAKNEKEKLPIASMTKMMSLSVIFDAIKEGKLSLEEKITISENAAETEGSQAFLDAGASYSTCDLIKSIIIASANDSTVALSERVAGSERLFANLMNEKAKQLNLTSSYFKNSTGLPEDGHYSSAKDCAEIYKTILNNEVYKKYANIWMDKIVHPSGRETELVNTNRLVKTYAGCSSGKTGYTSEAKYCLTTSATRNGTTLIAVVIGEKDSKTRFNEVREMLDFGFSNYESKLFLNSSEIKKEISVSGAKKSSIIAKLEKDYYVFSKINEKPKLTVEYVIDNLNAPIKKGDIVGKAVVINEDGVVVSEINLISEEDNLKQSMLDVLRKISYKW